MIDALTDPFTQGISPAGAARGRDPGRRLRAARRLGRALPPELRGRVDRARDASRPRARVAGRRPAHRRRRGRRWSSPRSGSGSPDASVGSRPTPRSGSRSPLCSASARCWRWRRRCRPGSASSCSATCSRSATATWLRARRCRPACSRRCSRSTGRSRSRRSTRRLRPGSAPVPATVELALLALIALTVVGATQALGNLLVVALIVAPALAAARITGRLVPALALVGAACDRRRRRRPLRQLLPRPRRRRLDRAGGGGDLRAGGAPRSRIDPGACPRVADRGAARRPLDRGHPAVRIRARASRKRSAS